ncbi:hypothetical protein Rhow_000729 [Rhodococcus wratislaviensis]|uniref:Uncharacterized protein n=1 Tax=Rhodococcus wratislaviensis TaxID=44752 RepID=A0A402C2L4_RHOWR|nr:hypothetical protein Rhow_000729 [Rhodococcus wratislaviensis]
MADRTRAGDRPRITAMAQDIEVVTITITEHQDVPFRRIEEKAN